MTDGAPAGFGARLLAALDARGPLCVGVDPHASVLADWGLADDAAGAREFGLRVVEAAAGRAGVVKPQVAFFERHGAAGFSALADTIAAARDAGLIVIADGKRGDIGSTVDAYGEAWLGVGGPFAADAATLTAWTGTAALDGVLDRAEAAGRGAFLLAATSNPEGSAIQTAVLTEGDDAGRTVAAGVVIDVGRRNAARAGSAGAASAGRAVSGTAGALGDVGVVIGATVDLDDYGIEMHELAGVPILAPGFGHQGARLEELPHRFGPVARNVVVASSRALYDAGPRGIDEAIARTAGEAARWRS